MPPKSAKAKAPPPKKAQARKEPSAPAKARKSTATPKPAPRKPAKRLATKAPPAAKAAAKKSASPPNDKQKASKRSLEEAHQVGTDDKPAPSQAIQDLIEAEPLLALSSALISKLPCEVVMELIERGCGGVNAFGKSQLTSPEGPALVCTVTPLILASYHGSAEVVNQLLNGSALVDACTRCKGYLNNAQAIHWAAARGHVPVVKALIANNATVDALTKVKWTPLHLAAQAGHLEVAELLLSSGADVHFAVRVASAPASTYHPFRKGWTALHFAADGGHTHVVELLIAGKAKLDAVAHYKQTALYLASHSGHIGVVKALLAANADVTLGDEIGYTPRIIAAKCGFIEVLMELISNSQNVNTSSGSGLTVLEYTILLEMTIPYGRVPVVLELLKNKTIVSAGCLLEAAKLESPEIMRALLANGGAAHINAGDQHLNTPLHSAARCGNLPMVEELIFNNADVSLTNCMKLPPVAVAAASGHLPVVKRLLACSSQVSMALCCAACNGNVDVLEVVLGHTLADVEEVYEVAYGGTRSCPLDIVIRQGHISALKMLLSHGVHPDGHNSYKSRPIHFASSWSNERVDILRLLLDSGADVDILDDNVRSALHIAAIYNRTASVKLLLESGADVFAVDNKGNTPKMSIRHDINDGSCEQLLARYERSATH